MEVGDRQPDIAVDPVWRGEHDCRWRAARACEAHTARPDCRDVWCRSRRAADLCEISRLDEVPPDPLAAPPTGRKAYAVDPPGRPTELPDPTPPDPAERVQIPVWIPITNLGSLLDILA